jgi:hypothetical protein
MVLREGCDRSHLASDAGVVHRHDRLGLVRDGIRDQPFVDIERIGADVHEDEPRSTEGERVGRS